MKPGDYVAYFSDPNNIVFMTAEEAGLGPEHYAGCDEAWQEMEAEAASMSKDDVFKSLNEWRKDFNLPPLTWEEFIGENNSNQS